MNMKYYVIFGFILFLVLLIKYPDWLKNNDPGNNINWSSVVEDADEAYDYNMVDRFYWTESQIDTNAFVKKLLENRFNISITYKHIKWTSYEKQALFRWASGDIPDIFRQSSQQLKTSAKHGFIVPIPLELIINIAPKYASVIQKNAEYSWNACKVDGKYYGLPLVTSKKPPLMGIWRKDWLKAVGFDDVPNTISEHTEVFERFKTMKPDALSFISAFGDDLDENQKQMVLENAHKTWGMTNDIQDHLFYFNEYFGAYGVQPFNWSLSNGELKWGGIQDAPRLALKQLKDWYDSGYIHPDFNIDSREREGLQNFFAGIVGYFGNWAIYDELHTDFVRNKTMAKLQRYRDIELLKNIGKSESEANALVSRETSRYLNLWITAKAPMGADGYRGSKGQLNLTTFHAPILTFGHQLADQPQKILRWLRIIEALHNDEELMLLAQAGIEGVHWRWQAPGDETFKDHINSETSGEGFNPLTYITDPESVMVTLEPYENMVKRHHNGLSLYPWLEGTSLVHFPHTENFNRKYKSKTRLAWENKYTPIDWVDNCIFGDIELAAPSGVASEIRRLLHYQQMIYAEFITGERDLDNWNIFVNKFKSNGGDRVLEEMVLYYDQMNETVQQVDSLLEMVSPKYN